MKRYLVAAAAVGGSAIAARFAHWVLSTERELNRHPDPLRRHDLGPVEGHERRVTSHDGTDLHVVELGPAGGRPVVLAHGYVASTSTWAVVAPRLATAGFRVVSYDQRGHGRSTVGSAGFGLEPLGPDLAAVVEALEVDDAILVGHSMGAMSMLSLAGQHAELLGTRVGAMLMVSTMPVGPGRPPLISLKRPIRKMAWFEWARTRPLFGRAFARLSFGHAPPKSGVDAAWRAYLATDVHTLNEAGEPLLEMDLRWTLECVKVPTIVAVGTHDRVTPPHHSRSMVRAMPDARLVEWPGAGHITPYERPDEIVDLVHELHRHAT